MTCLPNTRSPLGPHDEHDFRRLGGGEWQEGEKLEIPAGSYAALAAQPGYKARKKVDKVSYEWDALIGLFTASILSLTLADFRGLLSGVEFGTLDHSRRFRARSQA
jgi:hypothetical protein